MRACTDISTGIQTKAEIEVGEYAHIYLRFLWPFQIQKMCWHFGWFSGVSLFQPL